MCNLLCFTVFTRAHGSDARLVASLPVSLPFELRGRHSPTVTMAVLRICALLLLFDCQEAFHCCLVVACINRINMISIECHRSGERCPGKREFDNRIEINRVRSGEIMWLFPLSRSYSIFLKYEVYMRWRAHMTNVLLSLCRPTYITAVMMNLCCRYRSLLQTAELLATCKTH